MNISVIGTGYVGLVTGACFAEMGSSVCCMDIDPAKIEKLEAGVPTIYEPGLERLLTLGLGYGKLRFTTDLLDAIKDSTVIFLTLPTPPGAGGDADLSAVLSVSKQIAELDLEYKVIVMKSTVPAGTADRVRAQFDAAGRTEGVDYDVVSNPEFLREGVAVEDFLRPDRVVVGHSSVKALRIMQELYAPFLRQGNPLLEMDNRSAELTKYAANAFLATKISFVNEIANLCSLIGANVDDVRRGMGTDARIGNKFLYPGLGFGGSCFPKDVRALGKTSFQSGYDFRLLRAVVDVNDAQHDVLVEKIVRRYGNDLTGLRFGVWGLAFKANTDDVRESPAIRVINSLLSRGATISAFDPEARETAREVLGDRIEYAPTSDAALENADALVICTEWPLFRLTDFGRIREVLRDPVIFDGRNLYSPDDVAAAGIEYYSVGRPTKSLASSDSKLKSTKRSVAA